MSSDKACLTSATLELTQKIQLHFPRGIDPEVLKKWNGCKTEELVAVLESTFGKMPKADKCPVEHLIDCDADPFVPDGWSVEEHKKGGLVKFFDPSKFSLYLSKKQEKGYITGNDLRKELSNKRVYNANALDYLLAHTEIIPEECKGKAVVFWGTIYRDADGRLSVRYFCWDGSECHWGYDWLDGDFDAGRPAILAS